MSVTTTHLSSANTLIDDEFELKVTAAKNAIKTCLLNQMVTTVASSTGKDSGSATNLVFEAALELKTAGHTIPPIIVKFIDTLVENPLVLKNAQIEIANIRRFAKETGLPIEVHIASPARAASVQLSLFTQSA